MRMTRKDSPAQPRILIIVQNLPVPLDRRVWQECLTLRDHGFRVSVICPKGPGDPGYQNLDGVELYKYRLPPETHSRLSFFIEYAYCWLRTMLLSLRIALRSGFDVVQVCNPPDTFFPLGIICRPFGVPFVYDQHDLSPEMYISRFQSDTGVLLRGLKALERATYAVADHVITTNDSYAAIARERGTKSPDEVTVVRSAPDTRKLRPVPPEPELKNGRPHLAVWLGIMGPQDGVDLALHAVSNYVHVLGRTDCQYAFLGFGDEYEKLQALCTELDLDDYVTFTGRVDIDEICRWLSTASFGLVPDSKSRYSDLSTHNKTMEYMAFSLPVVTFDLKETRLSAGSAAEVVPADDPVAMSHAFGRLLDDRARAEQMGAAGYERLQNTLEWQHQVSAYVGVFRRLLAQR